ncbi:hypothetical protein ACFOEE_04070 [Pseudoalteromonas fenneropenaei]|uniref:PilZ domain-containing protein n=1 Tax=Pseudoalteromonas fenneropenaei TaxID=1737459 RepID=A0ABV7CGK3_9GAMM
MKLSKEEEQFLQELLDSEPIVHTNIKVAQQDIAELDDFFAQVPESAELTLIAQIDDNQVCFPVTDKKQLNHFHFDLPHIVDNAGSPRLWRVCPSSPTFLAEQASKRRFKVVSLSLSGVLIDLAPFNADLAESLLLNRCVRLCSNDSEDIPVIITDIRPRGQHQCVIMFDELTQHSPTLRYLLLREFLIANQHNSY